MGTHFAINMAGKDTYAKKKVAEQATQIQSLLKPEAVTVRSGGA